MIQTTHNPDDKWENEKVAALYIPDAGNDSAEGDANEN